MTVPAHRGTTGSMRTGAIVRRRPFGGREPPRRPQYGLIQDHLGHGGAEDRCGEGAPGTGPAALPTRRTPSSPSTASSPTPARDTCPTCAHRMTADGVAEPGRPAPGRPWRRVRPRWHALRRRPRPDRRTRPAAARVARPHPPDRRRRPGAERRFDAWHLRRRPLQAVLAHQALDGAADRAPLRAAAGSGPVTPEGGTLPGCRPSTCTVARGRVRVRVSRPASAPSRWRPRPTRPSIPPRRAGPAPGPCGRPGRGPGGAGPCSRRGGGRRPRRGG